MEAFLATLKKDVQCSLCSNTFIEPKILECFHTFCKLCIKRNAKLVGGVDIFKCSKCSMETELSGDDELLKPSLLHSRVLKVLAFVEPSEKVCSLSASHSPASWLCFDCDTSLCSECRNNHALFTKNHKVVSLLDLKREDLEFMLTKANHCKEHGQISEFFCRDCHRSICVNCFEKRGCYAHSTVPLDEHNSTITTNIEEKLRNMRVKEREMNKRVTKVINIVHQSQQNAEKAKKDIKKTVEQHIAMIQEKQEELMNQIDQRIDEVEQVKTRQQRALGQVQGTLDYFTKLIERNLAGELFSSTNDIGNFNTLFPDVCIDAVPDSKVSTIKFVPNKEFTELRNAEIGTIETAAPILQMVCVTNTESPSLEALTSKTKSDELVTIAAPSKLNVPNDLNIEINQSEKPGESQEKCEKAKKVEKGISGNAVNKENSSLAAADIKTRSEKTVKSEKCAKAKAKNVDMNEATKSSPAVPKVLKRSSKFIMKGLKKQPEHLSGIAVNKENSKIAIGDYSSHCVNIFNKAGDFLQAYGSHGNGKGKLSSPQGLAFLNENELVIADSGNNRICIVNTTTGILVKSFDGRGGGNKGLLDNPRGVHVDDDCNIIVSDNHRIKVFTRDGDLKFHFGLEKGECFSPVSVVTHDGLYYVSDRANDVIQVFGNNDCLRPTKKSVIGKAGEGMDGQLKNPWGLTIDNDHNLLVCDSGNQRIQKFTLDGSFIAKTTNGGIFRFINHIAVLKDNHFMVTVGSDGVLIFQ